MGSVESLETSIKSLVDAGKKLRKERDRALIDIDQVKQKLEETKETVKGLQLHIENINKNDSGTQEFEKKKNEIVASIYEIISKLE